MPSSRPRIGVTRWEDVPGEPIEQYWDRVREAGGEPVDLASSDADLHDIAGLILTGGLDIAPERYGADPHPRTKCAEPDRDAFEVAVIAEALKRDLSVLAICRGHQLLNVVVGGGLLQHVEDGSHRADYRSEGYPSRWHGVPLASGSRLREVFGADEIEVNSRHHQAVLPETLAPSLTAIAAAPDGVVEGVESEEHRWVVGVQWHPERLETDHPGFAGRSARLFSGLVAAAARVGAQA